MNSKLKSHPIIFMIILLFLQPIKANDNFDFEEIYFSSEIKKGDYFTWSVRNNTLEEERRPQNSTTLKVLEDPTTNYATFGLDGTKRRKENNRLFKVEFDGSEVNDYIPEKLFMLLSFTQGVYTNGTTLNFAKELWMFVLIDDFTYTENDKISEISISNTNELTIYNGFLRHENDDEVDFYGVINHENGVMQELLIQWTTRDGDDIFLDIFHLIFVNSTRTTLNTNLLDITINPFIIVVGVVAIARYKRLRV